MVLNKWIECVKEYLMLDPSCHLLERTLKGKKHEKHTHFHCLLCFNSSWDVWDTVTITIHVSMYYTQYGKAAVRVYSAIELD